MLTSVLQGLLSATLASSAAILIVGLFGTPLRTLCGARAAYWVWLLVPALVLAALLPAPPTVLEVSTHSAVRHLGATLANVVVAPRLFHPPSQLALVALMVWGTGACTALVVLLGRQRSFVRSLGILCPDSTGTPRSAAIVAPMLLGAWDAKVVLPADFEQRYTAEERELILAHERAHFARRDGSAHALAVGSLCLFWFNPLMYWAVGRLRLDQELACDAIVLARPGTARRRYADALLKTQLALQSGWRIPIGCQWQPRHPLTQRIAMLKRPTPGVTRHLGGIALALAVTLSGSYAAWAAQSAPQNTGAPIYVGVQLDTTHPHADDPKAVDHFALTTAYTVHSGEAPGYPQEHPFDVRCTPSLPLDGTRHPAAGQIILQCEIGQNGKFVGHDVRFVSRPALIVWDGQLATIELDDGDHAVHYRLQVAASTSRQRLETARAALKQ